MTENTVYQLLNFSFFVASLVLFLNNVFQFEYNNRFYETLDDNIFIVNDILLLIFNIVVLYNSIETPYETNKLESFTSMHDDSGPAARLRSRIGGHAVDIDHASNQDSMLRRAIYLDSLGETQTEEIGRAHV